MSNLVKIQFREKPEINKEKLRLELLAKAKSAKEAGKRLRPVLIKGTRGVYTIPGRDGYFGRPYFRGKQKLIRLTGTTIKKAELYLANLEKSIIDFEGGFCPNPFKEAARVQTVENLCRFYLEKGCPKKGGGTRPPGQLLKEEQTRVSWIMKWPGSQLPHSEIDLESCTNYRDWRLPSIKSKVGGMRQIDKELVTLSNIFRLAMRNPSRTGVKLNPIRNERQQFRRPEDVQHCRDFMPRDADELHMWVELLLRQRRSEVLAWQLIFEAMCGPRSAAMVKLRKDAKTKQEAGFQDSKRLYLLRSESHKGAYGHVDLYPELRTMLEAFNKWHQHRYPESSWYFPSPDRKNVAVKSASLTRRLDELHKRDQERKEDETDEKNEARPKLPKRVSHGMRAYRVNVLRSEGKTDPEIALLIGHRTGGKLIVEVYGEGLDEKIGYRPKSGIWGWENWMIANGFLKQPTQLDLL